jgi:hypothetical protein
VVVVVVVVVAVVCNVLMRLPQGLTWRCLASEDIAALCQA